MNHHHFFLINVESALIRNKKKYFVSHFNKVKLTMTQGGKKKRKRNARLVITKKARHDTCW